MTTITVPFQGRINGRMILTAGTDYVGVTKINQPYFYGMDISAIFKIGEIIDNKYVLKSVDSNNWVFTFEEYTPEVHDPIISPPEPPYTPYGINWKIIVIVIIIIFLLIRK